MMPSKKKKYNARFPAGRIKKIMQTDDDVGKVAQAVPVIISRALELFVESLLTKAVQVTNARNAKTLTPSHMKQCILSESRFDFLKDLVSNISEVNASEDDIAPPPQSSQSSNVNPAAKKERGESTRGRGRGRGRDSCTSQNGTALRQRKNLTSSQPGTPTTPTAPGCPKFYRELPINLETNETNQTAKELAMSRPPVIQHTGRPNNRLPVPDSGDEEEEDDENDDDIDDLSNHNTRPLLIDDDYDT